MKLVKIVTLILFTGVFANLNAQNGATGSWKVHLPFQTASTLTADNHRIYVGGPSGIFTYGIDDRELELWDKSRGLASLSVNVLKYSPDLDVLMIVYQNADIDLIKNGVIYNLPDIARKQMVGEKRISHIYFNGQYAYLSGSLGIIVVDILKREIKDSYTNIGPAATTVEVNGCTIYHDSIYAATHKGILRASIHSPNLADYNYWSLFKSSSKSKLIHTYNNKLFAEVDTVMYTFTSSGATFLRDGITRSNYDISDNFGNLIISQNDGITIFWKENPDISIKIDLDNPVRSITGTNKQLLFLSYYQNGLNYANTFTGQIDSDIHPNGPVAISGADICTDGNDVYVAGGNPESWYLGYNFNLYYKYSNGLWSSCVTKQCALDTASDIVAIASNSITNKLYLGSFGRGLYEKDEVTQEVKAYNETNSSLGRPPSDINRPLNISGLKVDPNGNLWVSNYGSSSPLSVLTPEGNWKNFTFPGALGNQNSLTDIDIDNSGYKWVVAVRSVGLLVFDDNGTIDNTADDRYRVLKQGAGNGGLPSNDVLCATKDRDGEIWVGTQAGLAVVFDPANVFEGSEAAQVIIGTGSNAAYLLGNAYINCITVDGGNRKWIGTKTGVWLLSPDGNKTIANFTEDNSPLISNNVLDIAINPVTGEVVMITDKGLISYFGDGTEGADKHGDVFVFPNPVRHDFAGVVSIRGLPEKANVKITDITGALVYETVSNGGMATWNGRNFNGTRVATGVYLVFTSNKDGSDNLASKILFIN